MKLLYLKLKDSFGSLKEGFEIRFRDDFTIGEEYKDYEDNNYLPFCFAGLNGSGKSNVLEALANIFYHLEGCSNVNNPENFKNAFKRNASIVDSYLLEYLIVPKFSDQYVTAEEYTINRLYKVKIEKEKQRIPRVFVVEFPFNSNFKEIRLVPTDVEEKERKSAPSKAYFPNLVIGYSSGENEILSIPFLKARLLHFDEYIESLLNNYHYEEPETNLLYVDYEMSQAVLLSNLIFQSKEVLSVLEQELGIVDIYRFRMNINLHSVNDKAIIDQYQHKIQKFKNCATCHYKTSKKLILDFWVNESTKEAFRSNFDDIFDLFRSFQILYTLNYRMVDDAVKFDVYRSKGFYTDGKIPTSKPDDNTFFFLDYFIEKKGYPQNVHLLLKNISDGEQQFLHTLGICLMLKNRSCLLLLDEPETHFNPGWRSKFISILKSTLNASKSNSLMQDILITSHSPFIISDSYPDKVVIFRKNEEGVVIAQNAEELGINTYGTSVSLLNFKIFKKKEGIGTDSLLTIEKFRTRFEGGENIEDLKAEINIELGDSLEKLILLKEITGK